MAMFALLIYVLILYWFFYPSKIGAKWAKTVKSYRVTMNELKRGDL